MDNKQKTNALFSFISIFLILSQFTMPEFLMQRKVWFWYKIWEYCVSTGKQLQFSKREDFSLQVPVPRLLKRYAHTP